MAKHIIKDARVEVNGVNLSDNVDSVTVNTSAGDVETTAMTSAGHERIQGLRDDSFDISFQQDFAAADVDATLWPLFDAGTAFTVKVRTPTSAAISPTNPSWEGTCILTAYTPFQGNVGELDKASLTLPVSGKISRVTA